MGAVLPGETFASNQLEVTLVDQGGRGERFGAAPPFEETVCLGAELLVDQREEVVERVAVPATPGGEQLGGITQAPPSRCTGTGSESPFPGPSSRRRGEVCSAPARSPAS